jgi:signal transduction histidine kinase
MPARTPRWIATSIPPATRAGLMRRALIVWTVALLIALVEGLSQSNHVQWDDALVYSYAISTSIWFFTDPMRIALHRHLHTDPPHYWALNVRTLTWLPLGIVLGYAIGTALGDLYGGHSSLTRIAQSPQRFWGVVLGSLGISLGFLFFFYQREKALSLEQQATEARLRLLETQLEPHMLFNTLANLRALIAVDPDKAVHMLDRLNDYLRATLRASRSGEPEQRPHTLQDEFARLRDYLELMAVRMGPRLRYALDLPPELARHPLPPLLLQPLVENAIRHGLEPHVDGGSIDVAAEAEGNTLLLRVSDTGAGCAGEPRSDGASSGFGLTQVRERLTTAFGPAPKGGEPRLQWRSAPGQGTQILLRLPLDVSGSPPPTP